MATTDRRRPIDVSRLTVNVAQHLRDHGGSTTNAPGSQRVTAVCLRDPPTAQQEHRRRRRLLDNLETTRWRRLGRSASSITTICRVPGSRPARGIYVARISSTDRQTFGNHPAYVW